MGGGGGMQIIGLPAQGIVGALWMTSLVGQTGSGIRAQGWQLAGDFLQGGPSWQYSDVTYGVTQK